MEFSHSLVEALSVEAVGESLPWRLNHAVGFKTLWAEDVCCSPTVKYVVGAFKREIMRRLMVTSLQPQRDMHSCLNPD